MARGNLLSALAFGYAIVSLPYVALALDTRAAYKVEGRSYNPHAEPIVERDVSLSHIVFESSVQTYGVINSTTAVYTIPEEDREVIYFRNFTAVGKKSEGFNITQWEVEHPLHVNSRLKMSPHDILIAGDFSLTQVFAGIAAGAALIGACILIVPGCGTFIGGNINKFVQAVGAVSQSEAGQAAIGILENVAANPPPGLPAPGKRDYSEDEDFGCYYENGHTEICKDSGTAGGAYGQIVQSDGSDENTPIASCWEASDGSGHIYGFYSHCFAAEENCQLQCGGNPVPDESHLQIVN